MEFLPLFYQLRGKPCLLIGGGEVALRKATLLYKAGAQIHCVAKQCCQPLAKLVNDSGGELSLRGYETADLDRMFLVVAATDNRSVNEQVSKDAHSRQMPVNVVDDPDLCSFILPAIVDRSPMMIAISSGGQSPVLARILRSKIESSIPAAYGRLGKLVGQFRDKVKARFSNIDERRTFWEEVLQGPAAELVFSGQEEQAAQYLADQIARPRQGQGVGEVYLVGAGPGDPDLLTFKALRLMQKADVVLYDRLVAPEIVDLTRRDAERIYVGKARANHAMPQQSINQLLLDLALEGKTVVRLKGGDPFIFGRGGEEIELLAQHQVPFQVVPGVTAASGCAAYSGIPLTHRDYAQSVRFITGHLKNNTIDLEWQELAQGHQTLVFYMGLVGLPIISQKLVEHGRSADTPVAIVQKGTTSEQRVLIGTLSTIAEQVAAEQIKAPTLLIIGEVVNLHSRLNWFTPGLAMRD